MNVMGLSKQLGVLMKKFWRGSFSHSSDSADAAGIQALAREFVQSLQGGRWTQVLSLATTWTNLDSRNPIPPYVVNISHEILGDNYTPLTQFDYPYSDKRALERIEEWIESLLLQDRENSNFLTIKGILYGPLGFDDVHEAGRLFEKAKCFGSNDWYVLANLARSYGAAGKYDEALTTGQEAVSMNPRASMAFQTIGRAYHKKGELEKAEDALIRATIVNPRDPLAWFTLGEYFLKSKRKKEARQPFEQAVKLLPHFLEARWNLGFIYYTAGYRPIAIKELKEVVKISPHSTVGEKAKHMLKKLGG